MLRTMNGKTVSKMIEEQRNSDHAELLFCIDGKTSKNIGHEGKVVEVKIDDVFVDLVCGENRIKLPNFGHEGTLSNMTEEAAEILLFMEPCGKVM